MQDIYKQSIINYLKYNYIHELIVLLNHLLNNKQIEYNLLNEYDKAMYDYREICFLKKEIDLIYERVCVLSNDLSNNIKEGE